MGHMDAQPGSERAAALAARLGEAASTLIAVIEATRPDHWQHIPAPGVWSIGKDAEHVIEATGYHEWIVRLSTGEAVSSRRPKLERKRLVTDLSPQQAIAMLRSRSEEVADRLRRLTDEQLDLPTRPPRARSQRLADTIELVLIDHYDGHRREIEAKRQALTG